MYCAIMGLSSRRSGGRDACDGEEWGLLGIKFAPGVKGTRDGCRREEKTLITKEQEIDFYGCSNTFLLTNNHQFCGRNIFSGARLQEIDTSRQIKCVKTVLQSWRHGMQRELFDLLAQRIENPQFYFCCK